MELIIKLTENDFKDNLVLSAINTLFHANKAITGNIEVKPTNDTPFEECDFVEDVTKPKTEVNYTENTQKSKGNEVDKEVQKLKDFANGIYKQLNEKSQKSLKKFVQFYTDKIINNGFRINPEKNWQKWIANDKNLK